MKKMIMYVYGDLTTDARVQRAANVLKNQYTLTVISLKTNKRIDCDYTNILVGGKFSSNMLNFFHSIISSIQIIIKESPDIVYCHDYYSAVLANLLYIFRIKVKVVYDAHELIIPDPNYKNFRLAFFRFFESRIAKKVNLLICASEERGKLMKDYYGLKKSPLIIRNVSQLSISKDEETARILQSLQRFFSVKKTTVVYAGVVTSTRRITELVDSVCKLSETHKLLIVGGGDALNDIIEKANAEDSLTFAYTGKVPYKSLGAILKCCDIGFIYYPTNTLNNIYCASNKIFEYASVSLPMISNDNLTVTEFFNKYNIGVSSDNFTNAILNVTENLEIMRNQCNLFTEEMTWENESCYLIDSINRIY